MNCLVYRVLLVDDDSIVLMGLRNLLDWNALGFQIVGEATDGLQAIELIDKLLPHLVITDINMRYCDGLKLMRRVKEAHPNIEFVVLSCHDIFDYAQNSLRLGALDYLLKRTAIDQDGLKKTLLYAKKTLDNTRNNQQEIADLKERLNLSMPRYRKQFVLDILQGRLLDQEDIAIGLGELGFSASSQNYCLMVIQLNPSAPWYGPLKEELEELDESVVSEITNVAAQYGAAEVFCIIHRLYACLVNVEPKQNIYSVYERTLGIAERIRMKANKRASQECMVYVHKNCGVWQLPAVYGIILRAVEYHVFYPGSSVLQIEDILAQEIPAPVLSYWGDLQKTFFVENEFELLVTKLLQEAGEKKNLDYYKGLCYDLAKTYRRFADEIKKEEDVDSYQYMNMDRLLQIESLHKARSIILDAFSRLRDEYLLHIATSGKHVINFICAYISQNFSNEITLDSLSKMTNFNKFYLCKEFKKAKGTTIKNFIMEKRISKAKEMLVTISPEFRIYEIAQAVGFSDASYFDRIFKKYTGQTPKEYAATGLSKCKRNQ